ncbi:MAG: EpsG family protein [Cyanobacterium sp. T60_A2020_053]|nr:EpsG family protein [Cyanobacterium sp. T60_A2020_053]
MINRIFDSGELQQNKVTTLNCAILQLFASFKSYQLIVLFIGLFFLLYIPILSLIPLLIYLQIEESDLALQQNILDNKFQQLLQKRTLKFNIVAILFTCILILSIYNSTIFVYGDTQRYFQWFQDIFNLNLIKSLEYLRQIGQEPTTLITIKYIMLFLGLDSNSFLLFSAFLINSSFIILTYKFVPKYYPLVILINVMSYGYYNQLFYFRQTFSFVFIIIFLFTENFLLFSSLFVVTFITHSTSLLLTPLLFFKLSSGNLQFIQKSLASNKNKYLLGVILTGSTITLILFGREVLFFLLSILSAFGNNTLQGRANLYLSGNENFQSRETLLIINLIIFLIYIFNINFNKTSNNFKNNPALYNLLIYFITLLISFLIVFFVGFNFRLVYFLTCLTGFFYLIPIMSNQIQTKNIQYYLFLTQLCLTSAVFIRNLYREQATNFNAFLQERIGQVTFWEARPLNADLFDYIKHCMDLLL